MSGLLKTLTTASRAGFTVERIGRMQESGVSNGVIAMQLTENSPNGEKYTEDMVQAIGVLYKDSKTKVVITKAQTQALINDQASCDLSLSSVT